MTFAFTDLEELRAQFDRTFIVPGSTSGTPPCPLLLIRTSGHALALTLDDLQGVRRLPKTVKLPGSPPSLMGLGGLEGRFLPIYRLSALLRSMPGADNWILLVKGKEPIGLSFEQLDGLTVGRQSERFSTDSGDEGVIRAENGDYVIESISALLASGLPTLRDRC